MRSWPCNRATIGRQQSVRRTGYPGSALVLIVLLSAVVLHAQTPYTIRVTDGAITGTVSMLHLSGGSLTITGRVAQIGITGGVGLGTNEVNDLIGLTGSNLFLTGFTELDPQFAAWLGTNTWPTLWDAVGSAAAVSNAVTSLGYVTSAITNGLASTNWVAAQFAPNTVTNVDLSPYALTTTLLATASVLQASVDGKLSSTVTNAGITAISNGVAVATGLVTNFVPLSVLLTNTGNAAGVVTGSGTTWGVGTNVSTLGATLVLATRESDSASVPNAWMQYAFEFIFTNSLTQRFGLSCTPTSVVATVGGKYMVSAGILTTYGNSGTAYVRIYTNAVPAVFVLQYLDLSTVYSADIVNWLWLAKSNDVLNVQYNSVNGKMLDRLYLEVRSVE